MAQKVSIELVSDISGLPGDETVTFGLDGVNFEVDVTSKEGEQFREALAKYIAHARKVGTGRDGRKRAARKGADRDYDPAAVRAWAQSNPTKNDEGEVINVPERGRIPALVLAAYKAAGN